MRGVLIALLPVAVALLACGYDNDRESSDAPGGVGGGPSENIERAAIDTGALLTTEPGQGIGALIEYQGAGSWHIHLACDTTLSKEPCFWDILVEPLDGARIASLRADQLDADDSFGRDGAAAWLVAQTTTDVDGIFVETDPGAALRVDVLIDGEVGNEFVYWIGDGAIHRGAPTNPIDLVPTEP